MASEITRRSARTERPTALAAAGNSSVPVNANNAQATEIDLVALAIRLLEKWYIIAICAAVGALIAGIYTYRFVTPVYTATTKLYVVNSKDSAINLSDLQIGNYLAKDYQEVFSNWHVHEKVMQNLGLDYTYGKLNKMVSVSNPSDTRILYINVTSPDPKEAQSMANEYARVAREFIAVTMDTQPNVFEEARLPVSPSAPNNMRNILMGFMIGFLGAAAVISALFIADDRIRTAEDILKAVNLPTLGVVTEQAHDPSERIRSGRKSS